MFYTYDNRITSIAFSPNGEIFASASFDAMVSLWTVGTQEEYGILQHSSVTAVSSIAFSPNGAYLAVASLGNNVSLWNIETGKIESIIETNEGVPFGIAFNPEGTLLAIGGQADMAGVLNLWAIETLSEIVPLQGHKHWVYDVAFNPAGTLIASGSEDGTIRLWGVPADTE
jgi:WD40 repeat protein